MDIDQIKREVGDKLSKLIPNSYSDNTMLNTIDYLHSLGYLGGVPEWQPIETYDYEKFPLVMLAGFITPSEYAQSNGSKPFWEISIGRCWHVNTRKFTGFLGQQPTHWMPLPAAPKGETK